MFVEKEWHVLVRIISKYENFTFVFLEIYSAMFGRNLTLVSLIHDFLGFFLQKWTWEVHSQRKEYSRVERAGWT